MADNDTIGDLVILRGGGVKTRPPAMKRLEQALGAAALKRQDKRTLEDLARARPGPLLERARALELVAGKGLVLKKHDLPDQQPLTLSPRRPHVEGRGHLNMFQVRYVFGENSQAWWHQSDDGSDQDRSLMIELRTTPGASYLVQIRVMGDPAGRFVVRGSDTAGETTVPGSADTIPVLVHDVDLNLSLISLHATSMWQWGLHDVTISVL